MYRLQRPDADMRVYLRTRHAAMTEHRLYPAQVRAVLQHLRRHGVTEQVAASFIDAARSQVQHHCLCDAVHRQARQAVHCHEQCLI